MSLFPRKRYRLGIAADHLSLLRMDAQSYQRISLPSEYQFTGTPQALLSTLSLLLEKYSTQGMALDVTVADSWARYWMIEPPANVGSLAELKVCAEARFQQLFGGHAIDWQLLADWRADRPFLATALPAWLCDGLSQEVRRHGLTLRSCRPLFIQQWHWLGHRLPADTWLGIEQASTLVMGLVLKGELRLIRTLALPTPAMDDQVLQALTREVRRITAESPHAIPQTVLHLGPVHRWPQAITSASLSITSLVDAASAGRQLPPAEADHPFFDGDWLALAGHSS